MTPILLVSEMEILTADVQIQPPLHASVPRQLTDIFLAYRELLAVHHLATAAGVVAQDPSRLTTLLCWAQMREYALSTRVTNLKKSLLDELSASAENNKNTEQATCVAVDYFIQILWLESHAERTTFAPFHHSDGSAEILEAVAFSLEETMPSPLTLWILFVAATVEFIVGKRGQQRSSIFVDKFRASLRGLGLCSFGRVRGVLEGFLFEREPFERYLLALVEPTAGMAGDPGLEAG